MGWEATFEGEVYREADLTLGEVEDIEKRTGEPWVGMLRNPARSASNFVAVIATLHSERTADTYDAVAARVRKLGWKAFDEMFEFDVEAKDDLPSEYEDGFPPKADEPSTPT